MANIAELYQQAPARYPELKGRVAVITGSGRGIGAGIAARLAREGMKLVLSDLDADTLNATVAEFRGLGVEVTGAAVNLADNEAAAQLIDHAVSTFGTIDLLVNNAADLRRTLLENVTEDLIDYQIKVNLKAPMMLVKLAAEVMKQAEKPGSVVSLSSVGGLRAHDRGFPYDATKGAIDTMTRNLAVDITTRYGIRANAIGPGWIVTERSSTKNPDLLNEVRERIPLKRPGTPLEIAAMVAFLASDDAAYITGQTFYVDGGITCQLSPPGQVL